MNIDIVFAADCLQESKVIGKSAIVIDVFRATSVITTALHNGANRIKAFKTVKELTDFKNNYDGDVVTGGERNIVRIEGFNLGNSPLEYKKETIAGKDILMTTTNGTRSIENAKKANNMYMLSFLNLNAVTKLLINCEDDLVFVCSGTAGKFSMEDVLCAGVCIDFLSKVKDLTKSDAAMFASGYLAGSDRSIQSVLEQCRNYQTLKERGYSEDLDYALTLNLLDTVPVYRDGWIYRLEE